MKRIESAAHLQRVMEQARAARETARKAASGGREVLLCTGGGCLASGSLELKRAMVSELAARGLEIPIIETGCLGPCARGPVIVVNPEGVLYEGLSTGDAPAIVARHLAEGEVVRELLHRDVATGETTERAEEVDFFKSQTKVVLRNCGRIDPLRIEDYIAAEGYGALAKALTSMTPDEVIEELKASGLRGRGGAGFPTWMKWNLTARATGSPKYIVCNADEGDPGAFMDRSLLEGDPHSVVEGLIIAGYTVGANRGFVYVRAEYPLAVERLTKAIAQAKEAGLLGKGILGSSFDFELEIRMGSGAFVCGEETALLASIEGRRGEPRQRPPFPAEAGLWGKPTVLNNVETYANVPPIVRNGSGWFAAIGSTESKGTKIFALAGNVNNTGLVEVPIGTHLGELIFGVGGGIKGGKRFKAAQIGGPSGGCIPREYLNVPLDYKSLTELGAIMGSGGLIVMDEDSCMVDVARFFLEFVQDESCGKCVPCRVGTKRMLEILNRICGGEGREGDIEELISLGNRIKDTALCGLGQTAANPVLSTIRHFRREYEEHIREHHCEAGVCAGLVRAPCQSACPAHVDVPGFVGLVGERRYAEALRLHRERNPFAAVCARVCFHSCEEKCRRASLDDAVSIRAIKRFMVDQEVTVQLPRIEENPSNAERKVAIVGAGPAGLSCAYFLARLGYRPTVYESEVRPGGMLTQTIPAYRLPRETLAREIRMIERLGVDIVTGVRVGVDVTLAGLREQGAEAVFLGVGAPEGQALGVPGEDANGVVQAVPFLKAYNIRGSVPVGTRVVVVGGGNAAIDAARTAIRLGAEKVTVLYRRTQEQMPAYAEEIEEAINEGVALTTLIQPVALAKDASGAVTGVRCVEMRLSDFDRSGRRRATEAEGTTRFIEADQVIVAIGQRLDAAALLGGLAVEQDEGGFLTADSLTGRTSLAWLFAGGDAVSGPSSVVEAIAAGERAAVGIDAMLTGEAHAFWRQEAEVDLPFDPDADPLADGREKVHSISVARRRHNFDEVELPWREPVAVRQSKRCLRCDYGKSVEHKEAAHA